jgi:hypothetical protein
VNPPSKIDGRDRTSTVRPARALGLDAGTPPVRTTTPVALEGMAVEIDAIGYLG